LSAPAPAAADAYSVPEKVTHSQFLTMNTLIPLRQL
jgi:hypothetical protein